MSNILFIIYDIIFVLGFLLYLPIYIYRKKITLYALREKLGFIRLRQKDAIWIQVVSVGEANLIGTLINKIREVSSCPLVISTTTLTGYRVAKEKYASLAEVIFFPFDIFLILRRVLRRIQPKLFIAVETEIWPHLFYRLNRRNIPIVIVNGRISTRAWRRYRFVKPIIKRVINKVNFVGVQNPLYKERFHSLGCYDEKIVVSGNMKFESISVDKAHLASIAEKYTPFLKSEARLLIIAGSTHAPEEEMIVDIYKDILNVVDSVSLLIAPRHTSRVPLIEKSIISHGFSPVKVSTLGSSSKEHKGIYILDTMGKLLYFYSLCDICFVGGSIAHHGGHNILEPIYFSKPTVFGPSMDNFKDAEEAVLEKGAGIQVRNPQELKDMLFRLIQDKALRDNLRSRCLEVFEQERRGLEKNLEIIVKSLNSHLQ
ncbi:MAG: hypothetical protein JSW40_04370 [Candidatus Omnitrophota bacterium]|nr:MAG: hypothetical protein JSW40_04370 [Candidatus Omnitrophota bacterium]